MEHTWKFVDRTAELTFLQQTHSNPQRSALLLVSQPGVGRTALLRRWISGLQANGIRPYHITATRSTAEIPLGAFAALPGFDEVVAGSRDDLERIIAAAKFARRSELDRDGRFVLVVDDAHLLDPASGSLIQHLIDTKHVFVVASVALGADAPDSVAGIWKQRGGARLDLRPLDPAAMKTLVSGVLGGFVDPAALQRLTQLCGGHLMLLRELIRTALDDGSLWQQDDVWHFRLPDTVSPALTQLVDDLILEITAEQRRIMELVAFAVRLTTTQLAALGVQTEDTEELENRQLLESFRTDSGDIELRVRLPIAAEIIRKSTPPGRARRIARQLVETLAGVVEEASRVAEWRLRGGGGAPDELYHAAQSAAGRHEHELALRLAEAAAGAGAGFSAKLLAAHLEGYLHGPEATERRLALLADDAVDDDQRGRLAVARLENLLVSTTNRAKALEIIEHTQSSIADPQWRDRVEALRIAGALMPGRGPREAGEAAIALIDRSNESATRLAMAFPAAYCLGRVGHIDSAIQIAQRSYEEHLLLHHPIEWQPWHHLWAKCEALGAAGRFAEADAIAQEQYSHALRVEDVEARAWFARHLASNRVAVGRVRSAAEFGRESVALFSQLGQPHQGSWASIPLAVALALAGDGDAADAALKRGFSRADVGFGSHVDSLAALGWIAVAHGDLAGARALLAESAEHGKAAGDVIGAIAAFHDLARLGWSSQAVQGLESLREAVEGELVAVRVQHTDALLARDPDEMLAASHRFEAMGAELLAAEAAFDAAVEWRKAGDPRRAVAAERRGSSLAAQCEGATTPGVNRMAPRVYLTPAELETAALASVGHTNRAISEMQHLSIRTVQNRLQSIYAKLGVGGREELAEVLRGQFADRDRAGEVGVPS